MRIDEKIEQYLKEGTQLPGFFIEEIFNNIDKVVDIDEIMDDINNENEEKAERDIKDAILELINLNIIFKHDNAKQNYCLKNINQITKHVMNDIIDYFS